MMETVLDASRRLRHDGFVVDFFASKEGRLRCPACGQDHEPRAMSIHEVVRYEGASDPDDQTILLALSSDCGRRGLYSAAFGAAAAPADAIVLRGLPRR